MKLLYSRNSPFGFVDPATATENDMFYAEEVDLPTKVATEVLEIAERLRGAVAMSMSIQANGLGAQSSALEMAEALKEIANGAG